MSADILRRAATAMRREGTPFVVAVADWLDRDAERLEAANRTARRLFGSDSADFEREAPRHALAVARAYLADPGDLPEVPE